MITTKELGALLRDPPPDAERLAAPLANGEEFMALEPPGQYDDPLGESTGGAALFGTTGGVTEAALRAMYQVCASNSCRLLSSPGGRGEDIEPCTLPTPGPRCES